MATPTPPPYSSSPGQPFVAPPVAVDAAGRRAARTGGLLALAAAALMVVSGWFSLLTPGVPLLMALVVVQLASMRAAGPGRRAVVGLALWTVYYLTQIVPGSASGITGVTALDVPVGIVMAVIGVVGPLLAGTAVVGAGVLTGWRRWTPLALGVVQLLAFVEGVLGLSAFVGVFWLLILVLTIALGVALLTHRPAALPA